MCVPYWTVLPNRDTLSFYLQTCLAHWRWRRCGWLLFRKCNLIQVLYFFGLSCIHLCSSAERCNSFLETYRTNAVNHMGIASSSLWLPFSSCYCFHSWFLLTIAGLRPWGEEFCGGYYGIVSSLDKCCTKDGKILLFFFYCSKLISKECRESHLLSAFEILNWHFIVNSLLYLHCLSLQSRFCFCDPFFYVFVCWWFMILHPLKIAVKIWSSKQITMHTFQHC